MSGIAKVEEKMYAGFLGKMIGVYLGRPVEGWPYEDIKKKYGQINYYVAKDLGIPLIVADDDLSGTCTFFRAMEDNGYSEKLSSKDIGESWLNYIIEDRTILWWGGIGNSTEHTAYLRLKHGIPAPESGSIKRNGKVMATQVGSQIFMEAYAMMCPGDPERAIAFVDKAVSVSHDGIAKEGACFLAALEALAFIERSNERNFTEARRFVHSKELNELIDYVENVCVKYSDWRDVRDGIDVKYGYDKYLGPAPFETNHAMVLAGILTAGDDFHTSVMIGASAGWDTDCNAGNIGCYNGIRLGLEGIEKGPDLITPLADRLIVVSSDGGECITDAVRETRKVLNALKVLHGGKTSRKPRFSFEYPFSLQGWQACPYVADNHAEAASISNQDGKGLSINLKTMAQGTPLSISTPTFFDLKENFCAYEMYGSPTLYETQTVDFLIVKNGSDTISVQAYIWYSDKDNTGRQVMSPLWSLGEGENALAWMIPEVGGMPVLRFGFTFTGQRRCTSSLIIKHVDWSNTPRKIEQKGVMMKDMWDLSPFWAKAFVPSAKIFTPNLKHTYCISHPEENGVASIGTRDFTDYCVQSVLSFSLHESGGLAARICGHRRYYACIFSGGNKVSIIKRIDSKITVLAETVFVYEQFSKIDTTLSVIGCNLLLVIDGKKVLESTDDDTRLSCGGAGFVINKGSMFIDGFILKGIEL